jgi:hypothetical protein
VGIGDPRGGWVRGPDMPEAKKGPGPGPDVFVRFFCRVFELPSPGNVQKRDKQNRGGKSVWDFFVDFFVKTFRHDFFVKRVRSVFELPSRRNTRKRDKKKDVEEKLTSKYLIFVNFLGKVFDMDFLQKMF